MATITLLVSRPHIYRQRGRWIVRLSYGTPAALTNAALRWVWRTLGQSPGVERT